jgi:predicted amidohydrolase
VALIIAAAQSASLAGEVAQNVAHHLRFAAVAAGHGVQLLIFPELSLTGYELQIARSSAIQPDSAVLNPLRDLAMREKMIIVVGAPLPNDRDDLYIGAIALLPDGSVSTYAKQHVHQSEEHVFTSGPGGSALRIGGATVELAICADATHPQHAANAAGRGADLYAVGAMIDDAGYARKVNLLGRYAEEHRMAVLLANYSGVTGGDASAGKSAIWAEDGAVVAASDGTEESLIIATKGDHGWTGRVLPV